MEELKSMLLDEQNRLETIINISSERLASAPEGRLRVSHKKKCVQYYHCSKDYDSPQGKYIPQKKRALACSLAQKGYDKKVLKIATKRLMEIKEFTRKLEKNEIMEAYLDERPERQELITPVELTEEQAVEKWMAEPYVGKGFKEGDPLITTYRGERVRSKSEKILADFFYNKGIPYKYECPLNLQGFGVVYPDFTFWSSRLKKELYWEHEGMMDDPAYSRAAIRKIQLYEKNDIFLGERLILTFETSQTVLDMRAVEKVVERYLL